MHVHVGSMYNVDLLTTPARAHVHLQYHNVLHICCGRVQTAPKVLVCTENLHETCCHKYPQQRCKFSHFEKRQRDVQILLFMQAQLDRLLHPNGE